MARAKTQYWMDQQARLLDIGARIFLREGASAATARRIGRDARCDDKLVSHYLGKQDARAEAIRNHAQKIKRSK